MLIALLLGGAAAAAPPNIVLIVADDLGWTDAGFAGSDYYRTPRLDALAAQGAMFTQAYAACANCAPSRAAILSGQYAPRTGVYTVITSRRGREQDRRLLVPETKRRLDRQAVTIAEALRDAGYATGFFGKWHLGDGATGPIAQGFDTNVGGNLTGHPASYFSPYQNPDLPDGPEREYLTTRLTDEAIGFIKRADAPFFCMLSYYTVHAPLQPEQERLERARSRARGQRHRNARYAAMIDALDDNVGRLLDALDDGLRDSTLVILTSDNGGFGGVTSAAPLRGAKGMFYEGGIRVPMLVRWPGVVEPGRVVETPVIGVDFYPTLLEIAGAEQPAQPLDGVSLAPLLRGEAMGQRALFWHFPAYLESGGLIEGPWRTTPCSVVRHGDLKLIEYFEDGRLELYDLGADPGEQRDLSEARSDDRDRLHALLRRWREDLGAPVPSEPNPEWGGG
ncbi:MAG: sulfatase [Phycisphaerales bacterium JB039]